MNKTLKGWLGLMGGYLGAALLFYLFLDYRLEKYFILINTAVMSMAYFLTRRIINRNQ